VNRSCIFCMFGMTLSRPLLTMQLTSSADVFTHVCRQKADTWSNYCDNIQPFEKIIFCFCKMWQFLHCFFWKLPQIRTSNFRKVMQQHTGGMVGCIIWVLLQIYFSFQQWKNFENPLRINKVIAMSLVYYFLGDKVCIYRRLSPAISLSNSNSNTIKIAENYSMQL